ncbi:hypothetical protein PMIN05_002837 [Paraphaeosphaeria minitans]
MRSDRFVTQNVLAICNFRGYRDSPGLAVRDKFVSSSLIAFITGFVILEELKVGGLGGGYIVDLGEVIKDGTLVRVWPGSPLDVDPATYLDEGNLCAGGGVFVA